MVRTLLILAGVSAALASAAAEEINFDRDIRPILTNSCFHCHGPDENALQAELRLDTSEGLFGELNGSFPVVPGRPEASEVIRRITAEDADERMPPVDSNRNLTDQQIRLLEEWVRSGAPWQRHWAFDPPRRTGLPKVHDATRVSNAIDRFVRARLEREGLVPSAEADKERLLRRVTLDLTGLPPMLEQMDAFLADSTPDAYEKVVDRLLGSPSYGERMAWDWLDVARYADTNGYQGDAERTMWPWRDWVIGALNRNLPFDQFTVWQIAGDLLPEATVQQRIATGFCRNHMINGEGGRIAEENRVEYIFDQIETVGTVWLGLTVNCCRCHDHKFDPMAQREYYQLFAFFNQTPVDGAGGNPQTPPVISLPSGEQSSRIAELEQRIASRKEQTKNEADRSSAEKPKSEDSNAPARNPAKEERTAELERLEKALSELRKTVPAVMVMQDMPEQRTTYRLDKGLYNQQGEEVTANVPQFLMPLPDGMQRNRLALARWLVDPSHALTGRVTVNRCWQMFFGTGLVKTAEDFGTQGDKPSHPALLDWLATELVRTGWDIKAIQRLMVTSATYRQRSAATPGISARDPDNRLLSRGPRYRLPSWMLRDQALSASGLLVHRPAGPPSRPYQPPGVWAEATFGRNRYEQDHGEQLYHRSLYSFWRRIVGPTMFFDTSKRQTCSVKTLQTNTPLHALITLNDVTYIEASRALAQRVMDSTNTTPEDRIEMAFRLATSRRPTAAERKVLLRRLEILIDQYANRREDAASLLNVGESPRNEKLDEVEHAAYTGICMLILNLDETLSKT